MPVIGLELPTTGNGAYRYEASNMKTIVNLDVRLNALGHRNWVILADAAYPQQCATGIETLVAHAPHLDVLAELVEGFDRAPHLRPVACIDAELGFLRDDDIPGVEDMRESIRKKLSSFQIEETPHEEILENMSVAASVYKVLVVKTPCLIPYSSVFFRLECGYWGDEQEKALRARLETWWQQ